MISALLPRENRQERAVKSASFAAMQEKLQHPPITSEGDFFAWVRALSDFEKGRVPGGDYPPALMSRIESIGELIRRPKLPPEGESYIDVAREAFRKEIQHFLQGPGEYTIKQVRVYLKAELAYQQMIAEQSLDIEVVDFIELPKPTEVSSLQETLKQQVEEQFLSLTRLYQIDAERVSSLRNSMDQGVPQLIEVAVASATVRALASFSEESLQFVARESILLELRKYLTDFILLRYLEKSSRTNLSPERLLLIVEKQHCHELLRLSSPNYQKATREYLEGIEGWSPFLSAYYIKHTASLFDLTRQLLHSLFVRSV